MPITMSKSTTASLLLCGFLYTIGGFAAPVSAAEDGPVDDRVAVSVSDSTTLVATFDDGDAKKDEDAKREGEAKRDEPRGERRAATRRDGEQQNERGRDGDEPQNRERDAEPGAERDGQQRDGFQPQTDRETQLYNMIKQLQREVNELKRRSTTSDARYEGEPTGERDRDAERAEYKRNPLSDSRLEFVDRPLPRDWARSRVGKIFQAYDRNNDNTVTLEEWYAMKEGLTEEDTERRELEAERFKQADPKPDGKMTASEFNHWYTRTRTGSIREGDSSERAARARREGEGDANNERFRPRGGSEEREREARERRRDGDARETRPEGGSDARYQREVGKQTERDEEARNAQPKESSDDKSP